MGNVSKYVSLRPVVCLQTLLERFLRHSFSCYHYPVIFSVFVFPQSLHLSQFFSTIKNTCSFWHGKFQKVSTRAFCSWDDEFTREGNCGPPNNLCKCTETPSALSTNISRECNLYMSWSSHHLTSFRLEIKFGGFSKHQSRTSDTDRYVDYLINYQV